MFTQYDRILPQHLEGMAALRRRKDDRRHERDRNEYVFILDLAIKSATSIIRCYYWQLRIRGIKLHEDHRKTRR